MIFIIIFLFFLIRPETENVDKQLENTNNNEKPPRYNQRNEFEHKLHFYTFLLVGWN